MMNAGAEAEPAKEDGIEFYKWSLRRDVSDESLITGTYLFRSAPVPGFP
jgi:hypothetical protein